MDFKDYYQILGVSPDADNKAIKKAYQALAKKYHPDLNQGDKASEEKFKEINEAYQAISDPAKRKKYDDLRANYQQWQSHGGRGNSFDWSAWQESPGSNRYTRTMTPEEFAETFGDRGFGSSAGRGMGGFSDFFSSIFGMGADYADESDDYYSNRIRRPQAGRDIEGEISITLEEAYHGTKRMIEVGGRRIEATVPKGIKNNNKIRLSGQGQAGAKDGNKGDLLLTVKIVPHPVYTRDGDDLSANIEIDFFKAVLGGEARVKTLGEEISIKIPPRTQTGKSFRLRGKGMPILNKSGHFGDFYAKITLVLPEEMSEKEISMLQELSQERNS
ncbi:MULTISPECIES: J domain-containing protein [Dehalobacter]|uniref:Molecular chaperone DnaJ n=1 Tax=Dehalobacter restrictus (strain DSM 9455 / PER-K23) TaxID=871738 RepID=A0ABM5P5N2_DEHRP|nr:MULTISPECIES: J domain-containing protein [Dehalobacter]AFV01580.1 chaperone DnaJ-like protein [Dehalobacter sp. DCA]AFV04615.1 chaperone DnaJ-like protein [Dehalobacter sp. CF]AHF09882.1 molecular chaperone DnaJ [Dehalobacter restrictus DSM 9455]EQB21445.1 DnaJ-class molecular chaperone CbpA [Dehalobacter sp. UNSWDHB]